MTRLTVTGEVTKQCPYKDERDDGTATLTFEVGDGDGPELHGLSAYLSTFRGVPLSHEAFTRALLAADYDCVEVVTRWETAGLTVECRAG